MRPEKMTSRLQEALGDAHSLAIGRDHSTLEPLHLFAVMLEQKPGGTASLLANAGADLPNLRGEVESALNRLATLSTPTGEIAPSNNFVRVLNLADRHAQKAGDSFLSSEQVLLAMFSDETVGGLLRSCGVTEQSLEEAIKMSRDGETIDDPNAEDTREALSKYTVDLTELAEQGKLDPVIGRDDEIRRTIQVLQRRTKNNPVLIGEPGVGKTAIVEGLAQRILNG